MACPALIYVFFNYNDPVALKGWAIPSATDIAFALGILSLLGPRVPAALKAFLLSVAIFDDLGAIIVIALFYTQNLSLTPLAISSFFVIVLAVLNRRGVSRAAPYVLVGIVIWVAVLKSGVHATLAGVLVALFVPISKPKDANESLLHSLEHSLHPWVAFGVLPVFAFANAGIPVLDLSLADLAQTVPLGISLGLIFGNQIGIMGMSWLAVKIGLSALPEGVDWPQIYGAAISLRSWFHDESFCRLIGI